MKLFTIEVCACGRITFHDVNCPSYWRGSGVYDIEYEVHREFRHYVSAISLERALKLVARYWFNEDPDWCDLDCVLYNPDTIKEEEDKEEGTYEEVYETDYDYTDPEYDDDYPIPSCYSEEIPELTLQEKLNMVLARWEKDARANIRYYKDKDDDVSKRIVVHDEHCLEFIDKLRRELRK